MLPNVANSLVGQIKGCSDLLLSEFMTPFVLDTPMRWEMLSFVALQHLPYERLIFEIINSLKIRLLPCL